MAIAAVIEESCSTDEAIEKLWKDALRCGWFNGYDAIHIAGFGLQRVLDNTDQQYVTLACVAATLLFKNGEELCPMYTRIQSALFISTAAENQNLTIPQAEDMAEVALQQRIPSFNRTQCSS